MYEDLIEFFFQKGFKLMKNQNTTGICVIIKGIHQKIIINNFVLMKILSHFWRECYFSNKYQDEEELLFEKMNYIMNNNSFQRYEPQFKKNPFKKFLKIQLIKYLILSRIIMVFHMEIFKILIFSQKIKTFQLMKKLNIKIGNR